MSENVLLPLAEGNYWVEEQVRYYEGEPSEHGSDTGKVVIEKLMTIRLDEAEYEVGQRNLHFPLDQPSEFSSLWWNGPDGLYIMGGIAPADTFVTKMLYYKYPVEVGDRWKVPRIIYFPDERRFEITDTLSRTGVAIDEPFETVLDTFRTVVYHHWIRPQEDVITKWHYFAYYAPGVGQVGVQIYRSIDTVYSYSQRSIDDLQWDVRIFDYCVK